MEIKTYADVQLFLAKAHREIESLMEKLCAQAEAQAKELESALAKINELEK